MLLLNADISQPLSSGLQVRETSALDHQGPPLMKRVCFPD
jgi:hypothetical protein